MLSWAMRSAFLYLLSTHPMLHLCRGAVLHSVQRLVASRKGFAAILPPLGITKSPLHAITKSKGRQQSWDAALQCRRSVVTHSTKQTENILVVHPRQRPLEHLHETLRLVETLTGSSCRHLVLGQGSLKKVSSATYIGPGAVKKVAATCQEMGDITRLILNANLNGIHQRNLEADLGLPVMDRRRLIIEIFAKRARTREARLQVELAALDYRASRLVRGVTAAGARGAFGQAGDSGTEVVSARQRGRSSAASGGLGGAAGAGESELQLQRRRLATRRKALLAKLGEVQRTRELQRGSSRRAGKAVVAVIGYTNAGKSSLAQALSKRDMGVQDKLFATLDPTLRKVMLPSGCEVLLSDTVGFITDLPPQLIKAFKSTLEEVNQADVLLHVLDASSPYVLQQREAVMQVLASMGVPQERLTRDLLEVWNKTDLLQEPVGAQLHAVQAEQTELLQKEQQAQAAAAGSAQGNTPAGLPRGDTDAGLVHGEAGAGQQMHVAAALSFQREDSAGQQALLQPDSAPANSDVAEPGHLAPTSSARGGAGAGQQAHVLLDGSAPTASDLEASAGMAEQAPNEPSQGEAAADVPHQGSWEVQQPQVQQQQRLNTADAAATAAAQGEDGRLTGGVRPTMVFVSAKEGRGLEDLLLEIDRKVSLRCATREFADGAARMGPRMLLQSMVGPPHRFKQPGRDIQQTWSSSEDAWLQQHPEVCQADSLGTNPQPQHDSSLSESDGDDSAQPAWLHRLRKRPVYRNSD